MYSYYLNYYIQLFLYENNSVSIPQIGYLIAKDLALALSHPPKN